MKKLQKINIKNWVLVNGKTIPITPLFYEVFGQELGTAPIVLVNHALTGNSSVSGDEGWWRDLIGENKTIDTEFFTVLAFNIPGNGYDDEYDNLIFNYKEFTARDIASIFWKGLQALQIEALFALIGGSLGGGIAWEMAALEPNKITHLIPIATDWKATDWVIANVLVQDQILNNSDDPIVDARLHAMLLYRTPQSLQRKFQRNKTDIKTIFQIEKWLIGHGFKLQNRFRLASYKLMNHLLKTVDLTRGNHDFSTIAKSIQASIHIIAVDSDLFFIAAENKETYDELNRVKSNVFYHEIQSNPFTVTMHS
ncbi:alpha/beta fold hydrolase [Flavobacterium sp.]|uniref:alpha/beta fold hydrolase n=1 Tax=Flavobacterium sp. TaxID=239 RepID=UPI00286A07F1|nr:alpha/beta fold hydrolase [Flavobacterium sp.]